MIKKQTKKHIRGGSGTIPGSKIKDLGKVLDNEIEISLINNDLELLLMTIDYLENKLNYLINMENVYYNKMEIESRFITEQSKEIKLLKTKLFGLQKRLLTQFSLDDDSIKNEINEIKQLLSQFKRDKNKLYKEYGIIKQTYERIINKITETEEDIKYFEDERRFIT